jgi:serine/threonine-protein kinase
MAEVFIGRLHAAGGFTRTVAVKRLHPNLTHDESFVTMLLDEARLAGRVQHPNVVSAIDVLEQGGEVLLVMEYVVGETLARLTKRVCGEGGEIPLQIVAAIIADLLAGLHAAHIAVDEAGAPLGIVHRDVSPQNILVGSDGTTRVLDFGIAKAKSRLAVTLEGQVKGKLGYMSPEQLRQLPVDARTDVFAAGVVLWECLTGRRLFAGGDPGAVVTGILTGQLEPPSTHRPSVPKALDDAVMKAMSRDPKDRFASAWEMAAAVETAVPPVSSRAVADWLAGVAGDLLTERRRLIVAVETPSSESVPRPTGTPAAIASPVTETEFSDVSSKPRRKTRWALLSGGVALALAATFTLGRSLRSEPPVASAPAPIAAPTISSEPNATASPAPSASSAEPAASASASASAAPSSTARRVTRSSVPAKPAAPKCKVERYVDASGTPRFRKVCK